jgi:hypothetical protein
LATPEKGEKEIGSESTRRNKTSSGVANENNLSVTCVYSVINDVLSARVIAVNIAKISFGFFQ